jgi:hypothetical protein
MNRLLILIVLCAIPFPSQLPGQSPTAGPPRQVYVAPFSHLDFFWGGTREECLARGNHIIAKAIEIASAHPEFRFLIEDENFVANYVECHPGSKELADLKSLSFEQATAYFAPHKAHNAFSNRSTQGPVVNVSLFNTSTTAAISLSSRDWRP